jgi:hypothetical protein
MVRIGGNNRFASLPEIKTAKRQSIELPRGGAGAEPTVQPEIVARAQELLNTGLETIEEHMED